MCNVELEYVQLEKECIIFCFLETFVESFNSKNLIQLAMLMYINMALVGNIVISDFFVLIL